MFLYAFVYTRISAFFFVLSRIRSTPLLSAIAGTDKRY